MYSIIRQVIINTIVYVGLCLATILMLRTIIGYTSFDTQYAFLARKQEYLDNKVWLIAFYTHVFTSIFTLLAGFTQFSSLIQNQYKSIHRSVGKMYVAAVLFINVPAGFIMAIYANGLLPSKIAFLILDILWFWFTWMGWRTAVNKDFKAHKNWMIRSYALTFSAITLRTWKQILDPFIANDLTLYMIDAWMGFVPNLLFAEWLIRKKLPFKRYQKSEKNSDATQSNNGHKAQRTP